MSIAVAALLLAAWDQIDRSERPIELYDRASWVWSGYRETCLDADQERSVQATTARLKAAERVLIARYGKTIIEDQALYPMPTVRPKPVPCDPKLDQINLVAYERLVGELEAELKK